MRRDSVMLAFALVVASGAGCSEGALSPAPTPAGPHEVDVVAAMEAHYRSAILAHDALIQGDLEVFRDESDALAGHELPAGSPPLWLPFHAQLQAAAREADQATDLAAAAEAMAAVVLACGACHESLGRGPVYPVPPVAERSQPLKAGMSEHQWATQMLWDGVTGPSGYAWERGAGELAQTRVFAEHPMAATIDASLLLREAALRGLGAEAKERTSLSDRAALYGRMLATCGGCHQAVGVRVPPYQSAPPRPSP